MRPRPVIALVATPKFKIEHKRDLQRFVCKHLYTLTSHFDVISTGRTHGDISDFLEKPELWHQVENRSLIQETFDLTAPEDLPSWRRSIHSHFIKKRSGIEGMIEIAHELVTGGLEAIIQLSVEDDTTVRAGSAVLRREANVYDVPIASDLATAQLFVQYWKNKLESNGGNAWSLFRTPKEVSSPCATLPATGGEHVLALIAHDGQKHQMCRFVVEYQKKLLNFDHILATGHSGELAKQYLSAAGWSDEDVKRIMPCNSGPLGGDVEIANAVIQGRCKNVVFFQDPAISHPHAADIRLFEQAVLTGTDVRLASNAESARILLEAIEPRLIENKSSVV